MDKLEGESDSDYLQRLIALPKSSLSDARLGVITATINALTALMSRNAAAGKLSSLTLFTFVQVIS